MMKFTTILKDQSFWSVKRQFTKKEGELLKYLIPPGCEVIHYRGLRRGAIIKLLMFNRPITFKVVTYTTDLHKLYFNDILKEIAESFSGGVILKLLYSNFVYERPCPK